MREQKKNKPPKTIKTQQLLDLLVVTMFRKPWQGPSRNNKINRLRKNNKLNDKKNKKEDKLSDKKNKKENKPNAKENKPSVRLSKKEDKLNEKKNRDAGKRTGMKRTSTRVPWIIKNQHISIC